MTLENGEAKKVDPRIESYLAAIGIRLTPDQLRSTVAYIDKIEAESNPIQEITIGNKNELSKNLGVIIEETSEPLTLDNIEQAIGAAFDILYKEYEQKKKHHINISTQTGRVRIGLPKDESFKVLDQLLSRATSSINQKVIFNNIIAKFKEKGLECEDTQYFDMIKSGQSTGTGTFLIKEQQNELQQAA